MEGTTTKKHRVLVSSWLLNTCRWNNNLHNHLGSKTPFGASLSLDLAFNQAAGPVKPTAVLFSILSPLHSNHWLLSICTKISSFWLSCLFPLFLQALLQHGLTNLSTSCYLTFSNSPFSMNRISHSCFGIQGHPWSSLNLLSQPDPQIFPPCPISTITWTLAKPRNIRGLTYALQFLPLGPYLLSVLPQKCYFHISPS